MSTRSELEAIVEKLYEITTTDLVQDGHGMTPLEKEQLRLHVHDIASDLRKLTDCISPPVASIPP